MNTIEFVDMEISRLTELQANATEEYIKQDIQQAINALESYKTRKLQKAKQHGLSRFIWLIGEAYGLPLFSYEVNCYASF